MLYLAVVGFHEVLLGNFVLFHFTEGLELTCQRYDDDKHTSGFHIGFFRANALHFFLFANETKYYRQQLKVRFLRSIP